MGLAEDLTPQEDPDARRSRSGPQNEIIYTEQGTPAEVKINLQSIPETEEAWRAEIKRVTGFEIPEHREVVLKSTRWWGPQESLNIYARFDIRDRADSPAVVDAPALLRQLRADTPQDASTPGEGDSAFVVSINDLQAGKLEGGGTRAMIERFERGVRKIKERVHELRAVGRSLGTLVVIGGGDLVEGCAIFANQAYELDADRRQQVNTVVSLILYLLDEVAPLFEDVVCLVVPGNHGENRIAGKRTTRTDNDDCAVFEHARRATERDPRLQHVRYVIAQGEPAKTIEVAGWILGATHGQVYGRGSGGSIEQKMWKWFSQQAAGRHPVGDADVLVTFHFHHFSSRDYGAMLWLQAPALDGGSSWLTDLNGQQSEPGMMTFVMTPGSRMQDLAILTT